MADGDMATEGFGAMLRGYRDAKGLTQSALAKRLGCSDGFIAYIETEKRQPSDDFLRQLIAELEIPPEDREQLVVAVADAKRRAAEERLETRMAFKAERTRSAVGVGMSGAAGVSAEATAEIPNELSELLAALQKATPEMREAALRMLTQQMPRRQAEDVARVVERMVDNATVASTFVRILDMQGQ